MNDGAAMAATTTTDSDADASNACLLRDEALRELAKRLVTVVDGMPLRLSIDTNSGYHAVTFNEWASPYRYKACVDGVTLGSFPPPRRQRAQYASTNGCSEILACSGWLHGV